MNFLQLQWPRTRLSFPLSVFRFHFALPPHCRAAVNQQVKLSPSASASAAASFFSRVQLDTGTRGHVADCLTLFAYATAARKSSADKLAPHKATPRKVNCIRRRPWGGEWEWRWPSLGTGIHGNSGIPGMPGSCLLNINTPRPGQKVSAEIVCDSISAFST